MQQRAASLGCRGRRQGFSKWCFCLGREQLRTGEGEGSGLREPHASWWEGQCRATVFSIMADPVLKVASTLGMGPEKERPLPPI